jgi:ribosomal protein S6--L-glutamate ligase
MKIWVLSQLVGSPGTERVLRAARAAGHEARLVHPLDVGLVLDSDGAVEVTLGLEPVELPEVAFTRMGAACPAVGLHVLFQLQQLGVPVVNDPRSLWLARDKVRTSQALTRAGLPVPRTYVPGRDATAEQIEAVLGPLPWVVKRAEGAGGEAVYLVNDREEVATHLSSQVAPSLFQRFVRESAGVDVRVMVIAGRARGAIRRRSSTGDFRSNLHLGGQGEAYPLSPELAGIAERAAKALQLDVAGVDLLESASGPLLLEVNGSPGFEGIEVATGLDLCAEVIALLEGRVTAR